MSLNNFQKAFTLLELLLVIAIIAVLAGIVSFALRPAENIQNAEAVRAISNAKDLEKALLLYSLDNGGNYPSELQNKFNSGLTRVDICARGQVCNGIDVSSSLVGGGYLANIPVHNNYGSNADSGYDVVKSEDGNLYILSSPQFLVNDNFITEYSSPIVSPLIADPGPGSWTLYDANGEIEVVDGALHFGVEVWGGWNNRTVAANGPYIDKTKGSPGLAFILKVDQITASSHNLVRIGWGRPFVSIIGVSLEDSSIGAYPAVNTIRENTNITFPLKIATVAGPTGNSVLSLVRMDADWKLLYPSLSTQWSSVPSPQPLLFMHEEGRIDWMGVMQLAEIWSEANSIATDRVAGSISTTGQSFSHEPDFLLEWVQGSLPSSDYTSIKFRKKDELNFWFVQISNAGDLELYKQENGVNQSLASASNVVSNGEHIVVITDDDRIRVYAGNNLHINYNSASQFVDMSEGEIFSLGVGGSISELVTWPRFLSGEAADILDNAIL